MDTTSSGPIRRYKCRSCGKEIVFNDEALTSSHAVPECEWFKALVAKMNGGVAVLGEDGREIKKP